MTNKNAFWPICAVALLCACSGKPAGAPPLARVGKAAITAADFERKSADVPTEYKRYIDTSAGRKQFLQILIREKLIVAAAADSDIVKDSAYIRETARMKEEMDARYNEFREYLLTRMWLDSLRQKSVISVTEDEIKQYHKQYPYEISISHIQLSNADDAAELLKDIKKGSISFSTAAKTRSMDAETASSNGKVRPFMVGEFLPDLENPAARMKTGETQGVFKSSSGWHILHKNSETKLSLSAAHDRIAMILEKKKLDGYLSSLQSKYPVEVLNESYK